ncbi:WD40 repeat-like protein [Wallemia mellicola]|nr:WD40 repeat-like protein [Wallemia mellicola]
MTARLFTLDPLPGFRPKTLSGHKDRVIDAYFSKDSKSIYTVSRDGAVLVWTAKESEEDSDSDEDSDSSSSSSDSSMDEDRQIADTRWGVSARHYFNMPGTRVVCSTFHQNSSLLIVGFNTGVFGLWELPSFTNLHTLSISQEKVTSVDINPSGEWLAFGARKLGQLLVWEWQSESYVLKQQGHFSDMNAVAYAPDGQLVATGGDDGKVKLWNLSSGFCTVTFSDHTSAISQVEFAKQGRILFSASLDGTVRAYDLIRYRNFKTFTSPTPTQFSSMTVDDSGEVLAAGSIDSFEIFLWSVQTGKLMDVMSGHQGPVSGLSFGPGGAQLASSSWDRTIRVWDIFRRARTVDPYSLNSDALTVTFRPDGKELAASTLDGQIQFWSLEDDKQTGVIEGRKDISGGRKQDDRITAANNSSGKCFNSLCYTADGNYILAGGNSKYVLLYDVKEGVSLKKFQISENLSLDGTQEFLDNRMQLDDGSNIPTGPKGDESDLEDRLDVSLPGAQGGDLSKRKYRPEIRTKSVKVSPTGRTWATASTDGLIVYSLDESVLFDPFDLDIDLTPESVAKTVSKGDYLVALVMAFRLNDEKLVEMVYTSTPPAEIKLIVKQLPLVYVDKLVMFIGKHMERSVHLEFDLIWVSSLLSYHGRTLRSRQIEFATPLRSVQKGLVDWQKGITALMSNDTLNTSSYDIDAEQIKKLHELKERIPQDIRSRRRADGELMHDDNELVRFLQARKWDIDASEKMFRNYLQWRKDFNIDELSESFELTKDEKAALDQYYPQFFHKTDKLGRPLYYQQFNKLDASALFEKITPERFTLNQVISNERLVKDTFRACSKARGLHVSQTVNIMDVKGIAYYQFWKIRGRFQSIIQILQDNYPELSGPIVIINAPTGFSTIWKVVKAMMDQATASKVSIHGSGYKEALKELSFDENLPTEFGGSCVCSLHADEKELYENGTSKDKPSTCAIKGPRPTLDEVSNGNFENIGVINKDDDAS